MKYVSTLISLLLINISEWQPMSQYFFCNDSLTRLEDRFATSKFREFKNGIGKAGPRHSKKFNLGQNE